MRIALLLPGNLASYFICVSQYMKLINFKDDQVDIYILYSNKINYIHTFGANIDIDINNDDIKFIKDTFNEKIKFLNYKEDITDYDEFEKKNLNQFNNNIQWYDDTNKYFYTNIKKDYTQSIKYMDQYIRLLYLFNKAKEYSKKNNFKYDFFIRARIDQYIDDSIFKELYTAMNKKCDISHFNMDNFFILSNRSSSFFEYLLLNIGKYNNIELNNYSLGPEIQFRLCLQDYINNNTLFKIYNLSIVPALNLYKDLYFYLYKGLNLSFTNFLNENSINADNIDEKYSLFSFLEKKSCPELIFTKYENINLFIFYSLFKR
jgi:hypothetical protein